MQPSKIVVALASGTAILGITALIFMRRNRTSAVDDDDGVFDTPFVVTQKVTTVDDKTKEPKSANSITSTNTTTAEKNKNDRLTNINRAVDVFSVENTLLAEALNEIDMHDSCDPTAKHVALSPKTSTLNGDEGRKKFPLLGLTVDLPKDWEIREEPSPVPNVAMLAVWNKNLVSEDAGQQQLQLVPIIVLSVEDLRVDNMDLLEFKDRTKELAVNQMLMMTGGAIPPMITRDCAVKEGPFRHTLEYAQVISPFYEFAVLNLIEVRHGIAYTFQIMCSPTVMPQYKPIFMEMASRMHIEESIFTALGYVEIHTGEVKVTIDSMWAWEYPGKQGALVTFTTTSSCKKEEISLYAQNAVPASAYKPRNEKNVGGVVIVSAFDGHQEEKTFTYNGYTLVVKPQQKCTSYLSDDDLISVLRSVVPSTVSPKPKKGGTFVNKEHGYQVDIVQGSRIVASRIGGGTIAYAPHGAVESPMDENQPPTVTIRIGTPESDPECMGSLDEWEMRMKREETESEIKDIKRTTINDEPCLTFMSQNVEEIAPGQRIEACGKVFVFVHDGKTTLIRWEVPGKHWKKYERDMNDFVESLKFI